MGIFGQLPEGQTGSLCQSIAVTTEKARQIICQDIPSVRKDSRPHLLMDDCLNLFVVDNCGKVLRIICVGATATWQCVDCCPQAFGEVKAVWGESLTDPEGLFVKLPDGRVFRLNLADILVPVEIACEPSTHQECITCVVADCPEDAGAVSLDAHRPWVRPEDYSVAVAVACAV